MCSVRGGGDSVLTDAKPSGLERFGAVWSGLERFRAVWSGLERFGAMVRSGLERFGGV